MSYRIVRITNLYKEYVEQYYEMYPNIKQKTFLEQYTHLVNDSVDTVSSMSENLRNLGVEAFDIFTNAYWLQNQWKIENDCGKSGAELVLEQIKKIRPDILWLDDTTFIETKWISYVRETIQSIKIITAEICAPYSSENLKNLKSLDFLITCTPCLREEFLKNGIDTYLIYHAFDSRVFNRLSHENSYPKVDLLFTGSLYTGGGFHKTRIEYLEKFLESDLPVKIFGRADTNSKIFAKMIAYHSINTLRKIGAEKVVKYIPYLKNNESFGDTPIRFYSKKLEANLFDPVYGLEQFKLLSKASICFNIHGEIARGCAGNLRLFEATGVGSCLVTDWKENLRDLFELEKEVVTYKSKEECIDKIKWLLHNPSDVQRIRNAGQSRTLKDHTFQIRSNLVNEILTRKLTKKHHNKF